MSFGHFPGHEVGTMVPLALGAKEGRLGEFE